MTIEQHPVEGAPDTIPADHCITGKVDGILYQFISKADGFFMRREPVIPHVPDIRVLPGKTVSLDTGTILLSVATSVKEEASQYLDYPV